MRNQWFKSWSYPKAPSLGVWLSNRSQYRLNIARTLNKDKKIDFDWQLKRAAYKQSIQPLLFQAPEYFSDNDQAVDDRINTSAEDSEGEGEDDNGENSKDLVFEPRVKKPRVTNPNKVGEFNTFVCLNWRLQFWSK